MLRRCSSPCFRVTLQSVFAQNKKNIHFCGIIKYIDSGTVYKSRYTSYDKSDDKSWAQFTYCNVYVRLELFIPPFYYKSAVYAAWSRKKPKGVLLLLYPYHNILSGRSNETRGKKVRTTLGETEGRSSRTVMLIIIKYGFK